jgi:hypothetical protein
MNIEYLGNVGIHGKLDAGMNALFFDSGLFMKVRVLEIFQITGEVIGISLEVCSNFFGSIINTPKVQYFSYEENQRRDFKVSGILERHTLDRRRLTLLNLNIHLVFEEEILNKFEKKVLNFDDLVSSVFF